MPEQSKRGFRTEPTNEAAPFAGLSDQVGCPEHSRPLERQQGTASKQASCSQLPVVHVACEQLISAITGQRHGHMLSCQLTDEEGGDRRIIRERLVELLEQARDRHHVVRRGRHGEDGGS